MSARYIVGLCRCEDYTPQKVREAVKIAVENAGGLPQKAYREDVLLKVNLLAPRPPEDCVTTHPEVVRGVINLIQSNGRSNRITVGDNPGYIFTSQKELLLERTGMKFDGVQSATLFDKGFESVTPKGAAVLKELRTSSMSLHAPVLINMPKLKTHIETEMSGALKNMFGTADTDTRKRAHKSPDKTHLINAILDIYEARVPDFHVMDAIISMEGNGPSHGAPRKTGWIIASDNALAADYVAASVINYQNPLDILLLREAAARNLGPSCREEINLVGASWEDLPVKGYKRATRTITAFIPTPIRGIAHHFVKISPILERAACVKCKICASVCPPDAINFDTHNYPKINYSKCVRCLCCHEMCPVGAMKIRRNWLAEIIHRVRR